MPHPVNFVVVAASVAELVGTLFAVSTLLGLRRVFPRSHMVAWSWAWMAAGVRLVLPALTLGAAAVGAAWLVSRRKPGPPAVGDRLLGGTLAIYGVQRIYEGGLYLSWLTTARMPAHVVYLGFADFVILGLLGLGTVVCLLEDEHRLALRAIRERAQSEHALEEERDRLRLSEEKFAKVFRGSPDAITISSLKDGRFLDVSGGFERILGYAPSEVLGRTSLEMGLWADPADRARIVRALERGRISDLEVRYKTRAGEARFLQRVRREDPGRG